MWILVLALAQEPDPFLARAEAAGTNLLAAEAWSDQDRWARQLEAYSADPNPKVAKTAQDHLASYVRGRLSSEAESAVWVALDTLLRHGHRDRVELVVGVVQSRLPAWTRNLALGHLESLPYLCLALADPRLTGGSAVRIGRLARGSRDATLVRRLLAEGEAVRDPVDLGSIAWALRAIGGDDAVRPVLAAWIDRLRGWQRTDVAWCVHRIDPRRAIDRLVELGALPHAPDPGRFETSLRLDEEGPSPHSSVWVNNAFADTGGLVRINVARLREPWNYQRCLEEFAAASRGLLKPEEVVEKKGELTFKHRGRAYKVAPRDRGDWYDLPPLFKTVNQALEDDDVPQRFVGVEHYLHIAAFVLTVPDRFEKAAKEFHLALEPDPDAARKRWLNER